MPSFVDLLRLSSTLAPIIYNIFTLEMLTKIFKDDRIRNGYFNIYLYRDALVFCHNTDVTKKEEEYLQPCGGVEATLILICSLI